MSRDTRTPPDSADTFSRRDLLRGSGASADDSQPSGGSDFEFTSRLEQNSKRLNSVNLVEVAIVYDGVSRDDEWPMAYEDDFVRYAVDDERKVLFLNEATRQKQRSVVKNSASVVRADREFVPASGVVVGGEFSQFLDIALGDRTDVSRSVLLETEHRPPAISVSVRDDRTAVITVRGERYEVKPGRETSIKLEEETVEIRRRSTRVKEVEDPKFPGETTLVRGKGSVETVSVAPNVVVQNSGRVEAYGERS